MASAVIVAVAPVITIITGGDVDGLKAAGSVGVNTAVNGCDPLLNVDVVPVATPPVTGTGLPRLFAPSLTAHSRPRWAEPP
jgi:hypothetical protein